LKFIPGITFIRNDKGTKKSENGKWISRFVFVTKNGHIKKNRIFAKSKKYSL